MIYIAIFAVIVLISIYQSKHEDHSIEAAKKWKPYFAEGWSEPPNWVLDALKAEQEMKEDEERLREEYRKNHYYDVFLECWIKEIGEGKFVRSVEYEDWDEDEDDEFEPVEPIYFFPANEAVGDLEKFAEEERLFYEMINKKPKRDDDIEDYFG